MNNRRILITSLLAAVLFVSLGACGGSRGYDPSGDPSLHKLYIGAYLAPGAPAAPPTTVRIAVSVWDLLLPVNSFAIDPDGEGDAAPEQVEFFQQFGKRGVYTEFYFDFEWNGPNATRGIVSVTTAGGTFGGIVELTLDQLPPWPY
jgi:hypothetical protein